MNETTVLHKPAEGAALQRLEPGAPLPDSGWVWIDMVRPDPSVVRELAASFNWDRVSVEDVLEDSPYPKFSDFGQHVFVVLHAIEPAPHGSALTEVDSYLHEHTVVTIRHGRVEAVDNLISMSLERPSVSDGGPDRMLARIAALLPGPFLALSDDLELRMESLEQRAIVRDPAVIAEVQALRRDVVHLRRSLAPQREVLLALTREDATPLITRAARLRFADAYEQVYRISESLDAARLMLASILETYRSAVAEDMNRVMKVLTVFSATLLPITLLAGLWGMNFSNMPELAQPWGYPVALSLMAVIALSLWGWFARRGFVGGPRLRDVPRSVGLGVIRAATLPLRSVEAMARSKPRKLS